MLAVGRPDINPYIVGLNAKAPVLGYSPWVVVVLPGIDTHRYYKTPPSFPSLGSAICLLRLPVSLVLM